MAEVRLVGISTRGPLARALRRAGHTPVTRSSPEAGQAPRHAASPVVIALADGARPSCDALFAAVAPGCGAPALVLLRAAGERRFEVRVVGGIAARRPVDAHVDAHVDFDGVAALVEALAGTPMPAPPAAGTPGAVGTGRIVVGGVVLDATARTVHRDGEPIRLNPREFDLLAYLMRHAGEVVYREQLLAEVWRDGPADPARSQTHAVHMRWLRQKFERDPSHPAHLLTVRRVGYTFRP